MTASRRLPCNFLAIVSLVGMTRYKRSTSTRTDPLTDVKMYQAMPLRPLDGFQPQPPSTSFWGGQGASWPRTAWTRPSWEPFATQQVMVRFQLFLGLCCGSYNHHIGANITSTLTQQLLATLLLETGSMKMATCINKRWESLHSW